MSFNVPADKIAKGIYWSHGCTVVEGCTPVSEGCDNCWAAAMAHQYKRDFSKVAVHLDRLERVVKGKPGKLISLWNDLCHEQLSMQQHNQIMSIIDDNQQHTFLALTKRPSFILPQLKANGEHLPYPPNLWLGTTAENQELADIRIPELLKCGSPKLFLSLEPLLGPIDISFVGCPSCGVSKQNWFPNYQFCKNCGLEVHIDNLAQIKWTVVGCETGPNCRLCDPEWIRSIVQQCQAADVPCFVKAVNVDGKVLKDWNKPGFPNDLKVRDFPQCTAFEVEE